MVSFYFLQVITTHIIQALPGQPDQSLELQFSFAIRNHIKPVYPHGKIHHSK